MNRSRTEEGIATILRIFIDFGFYRQKREKAGLLSIKKSIKSIKVYFVFEDAQKD